MIKQVVVVVVGFFLFFFKSCSPPAPVQQGFLERRVVGEENGSELITLGTDPEKGEIKK